MEHLVSCSLLLSNHSLLMMLEKNSPVFKVRIRSHMHTTKWVFSSALCKRKRTVAIICHNLLKLDCFEQLNYQQINSKSKVKNLYLFLWMQYKSSWTLYHNNKCWKLKLELDMYQNLESGTISDTFKSVTNSAISRFWNHY